MATIELADNDHDVYHCNNCDITFSGEPKQGFKFLVGSETSARFDDDNDFFLEGSTKVIVGRPSYACHNDDYPCFLDEGDWTVPKCQMFVCSCGTEFTFDNDYCSAHSYSSEEDARNAAQSCLGSHNPETVTPPKSDKPLTIDDVKVGDRIRVSHNGASGSGWMAGDIIEVSSKSSRWCRGRCVISPTGTTEGSEWNINYEHATMYEPAMDDELADKFRPKTAEKKVRYIDL